ncbi:Demethylspheroidene O-methyltransferase [Roseivivax jejudonensis]|uniref:Demethylspheroidene O-methyltransferase n=1 Tax=Roseivivax jejudonensis TaxID=1529041 RepID=A0A1X6ZP95_9RHOB|nr:methyltransferase [Roseivivax jejudonensis]SLN57232.1 Demethylspheroidene O-methyltransferase [Roseivivax jejudonensis]
MAAPADLPAHAPRPDWRTRVLRWVARPGFQAWAARFPLSRRYVRRKGTDLFDLVQGFVSSQVLLALVDLQLCHHLADGPRHPDDLAGVVDVRADRLARLLQAGAALGLLRRTRDGRFGLEPSGAALIGVPGLEAMIAHHRILYRDLADPVAFLRGDTEPELAQLWPYVFGAGAAEDPARARRYSRLMADSQALVAADTLGAVSLSGVTHLLDVGGGTGVFAEAAARANPQLQVTLMELPAVAEAARERLAGSDVSDRIDIVGGSFRDEALPTGADAISLVRVLFDHEDDTVVALLERVYAALPPGGTVIVSEPMSGGARPDRAGDVFYSFYTMAMGTGTVRAPDRIARLLTDAGFVRVSAPRPLRSFVTRVVTATRP